MTVAITHRLEKDLIEIYGKAKVAKRFTRMGRAAFYAFCDAAETDPVRRNWLETVRGGYDNVLSNHKKAA